MQTEGSVDLSARYSVADTILRRRPTAASKVARFSREASWIKFV